MGTPGDKSGSIKEVVKTEPEETTHRLSDPQQQEIFFSPQAPPPQGLPVPSVLSSPEQTTSIDMGVIERIPYFRSLVNPPTHLTAKPDAFRQVQLEQSTIEHYYGQTKHYPDYQQPSTSYPLPSKPKTFLIASDQPGPSGLQTPKTKLAASVGPGRLKKAKKVAQEQQGTPQTRKTYQCNYSYCKKTFTSSEKLERHEQTHLGSSPFKCENCKKTFTSKFKLVRHALIHSDRKPFSCTVCDRTFHRKDHLKNHIKVHSPQKIIHVCEACKKQYTSLLSYRKHLALHAAEEGNLTCQMCSETFDSKDDILYHLKIHAGSRTVKNPNDKKFKCEQCGRKFFTRKDVRRHNVVHTGNRDFLCQFCPQRFGRKDHLVRHIKKSHNTKYVAEDTVTTATIKAEPTESIPPSDVSIKSEFSESSLSNAPETFGPAELSLPLIEGDLTPFLEESEALLNVEPLKDLGSTILEDIGSAPSTSGILTSENIDASQTVLDDVVLNNAELLLLQSDGDKNLPLPGFSQTFQSPPPGPPPL
ncbi:zinc finger protein PLAG1-like [Diorhabda carinulata]|uniref:zinc finger protein PLAG1-like n=1 Tax=Diorhabda carinulata TaxID=1163345 RepID=UPI0025A24F9F|nr:zinc finger protein PLAG1-like [Diorhabda carinulata]